MARQASFLIALFLMCFSVAAFGQYGGHHGGGSGAGSRGAAPGQPADNPDLTGFKHDVAVQATEAQTAQFQALVKSTEAARQKAIDLQQIGAAGDAVNLTQHATSLQAAVVDTQKANRDFVNSFSDAQDAGLKKLTKQLNKSDAAVTKHATQLNTQLDKTPPFDAHRLASVAANLEKALTGLQSDQSALAKEMGIDSH